MYFQIKTPVGWTGVVGYTQRAGQKSRALTKDICVLEDCPVNDPTIVKVWFPSTIIPFCCRTDEVVTKHIAPRSLFELLWHIHTHSKVVNSIIIGKCGDVHGDPNGINIHRCTVHKMVGCSMAIHFANVFCIYSCIYSAFRV